MGKNTQSNIVLSTYSIEFRFRSIPQAGKCSVTLIGDRAYSSFSISSGTRNSQGMFLSLPLTTDQLRLDSFALTSRSLSFTVAAAVTMLDFSLYVSSQQPVLRGYINLPRGTDLGIVTPWDRLDVIGNSVWTACCVDPDGPNMFLGRLDGTSFTRSPGQVGQDAGRDAGPLSPAAAQMVTEAAALASPIKERTKP